MDAKDRPTIDWNKAIAFVICMVVMFYSMGAINQRRSAVFPFAVSFGCIIWLCWPYLKRLFSDEEEEENDYKTKG
jgi:hypothetical protein